MVRGSKWRFLLAPAACDVPGLSSAEPFGPEISWWVNASPCSAPRSARFGSLHEANFEYNILNPFEVMVPEEKIELSTYPLPRWSLRLIAPGFSVAYATFPYAHTRFARLAVCRLRSSSRPAPHAHRVAPSSRFFSGHAPTDRASRDGRSARPTSRRCGGQIVRAEIRHA